MEVNPLNIFFVKSDSKGDRLLFRYPYTTENKDENKQKNSGRQNPYAINSTTEELLQNPQSQTSNISKGQLSGFTDEMLSTLFAVKAELCNRKFELKVNDVRFVGHPTLLPYRTSQGENTATILINIVFALQASASHSIVKCYYDLSKRLGKALRHEEKRCSYLTEEVKIMLATHDEISSLDSELNSGDNDDEEENSRHSVSSTTFTLDYWMDRPKSAFHLILQRSSLARSMKAVFEELSSTGIVQVRINKYVLLSFCLPHKAHQIHNKGLTIEPETIDKCIQKLRPYHGILLMVNPNDLLMSIPLDGSAALLRLIKLYSPLKSLQTMAIEADLTLPQVFQLTGHLVYWAKATVIYPLCEGNVYVVAPGAAVHTHSPLCEEFVKEFPGLCLLQLLSEFSLPAPLWYAWRGRGAAGGARLARAVAWLLRRRLLLQLHTYVQFNSHWGHDPDGKEYFCEKHDIYNQSCSVSFSSLNHMQLNVPEPVEPRVSSSNFLDSDEHYPTENNLNQTDFSHTKPIVIESDYSKYDKYHQLTTANHSFDEGIDVVDGVVKVKGVNGCDYEKTGNGNSKRQGNSVDSGISNVNGTNGVNGHANGDGHANDDGHVNGEYGHVHGEDGHVHCDNGHVIGVENGEVEHNEPKLKTLPSRLSDNSLRDSVNGSDDDKFDTDSDITPRLNGFGHFNGDKKNGVSLNLRLQSELSFQPPTVWGAVACECAGALPSAEAVLATFSAEERAALAAIPAASHPDDLLLLARLHKKGYFRGEQHLEEIMFMENVTRSQLMQLLDKFKDILITFETEDPAVAMLYPYQ